MKTPTRGFGFFSAPRPQGPPRATGLPPRATGLPPQATGLPSQATGLPPRATGLPSQATGLPPRATGYPPAPPWLLPRAAKRPRAGQQKRTAAAAPVGVDHLFLPKLSLFSLPWSRRPMLAWCTRMIISPTIRP
ncbi:MAG: DUF1720 domain-containing protein [Christensenellales bacterium]